MYAVLLTFLFASARADDTGPAPDDPYGWLEDLTSERSLTWVKARDAEVATALQDKGYDKMRARIKAVLDSDARIPYVAKRGDWYYNFWQDAQHKRGIWRRTTLEEYKKAAPAWETVFDLDALDAAEKVDWVWHGSDCLEPEYRRCLLSLSRGGSDADEVREFDVVDKAFVPGGFYVPEARNSTSWINKDRIWVMTKEGDDSLTTSGYPREARAWDRGTPLADAPVLFAGDASGVASGAYTDPDGKWTRHFAYESPTFFTNRAYVSRDGLFTRIDVPEDAQSSVYREWLFIQTRSAWTIGGKTWKAGTLLVTSFDGWMAGKRDLEPLFEPTARTSLGGYVATPSAVTLEILDNVRGRVTVMRREGDKWVGAPMAGIPEYGTVSVSAVDPTHSDDLWLITTDFLTPTRLSLASAAPGAGGPQVVKQLPALFNAKGLEITQHEATSKDGTKIPYFQVSRVGLKLDGKNPTMLDGYGGFEASMVPYYDATKGVAWLEKGGVYVLANIRGGGEFGPDWHMSAIKQNRHLVYEDFAAIAQDLSTRGVADPKHLGAWGGSNGGLLMGNMMVQYPELFGAIVCTVPLLDMKRYSHLLAGASWMDEYGDPDDPVQWEWIKTFSPYHLDRADRPSPPVLFITSTRDDRVHPGHARKMAAKMLGEGKDVLFFEDTEGGHGGSTTSDQRATNWALTWAFYWKQLR